MSIVAQVALGLGLGSVLWLLVTVGSWWVHRIGTRLPWNWRVLVWPDVYYRWLDRKGI